MSVGTYLVKITCMNCIPERPSKGIITNQLEPPLMHSIGATASVDVYPAGTRRIRGAKVDGRLEYEFTCLSCGRRVWMQVREETK